MKHLNLALTAGLTLNVLSSCGPVARNSSMASRNPHTDYQATLDYQQKKWDALAAELGIHNNQISLTDEEKTQDVNKLVKDKLKRLLKKPSSYLEGENSKAFEEKLTNFIVPRMLGDVYATRGAEIVDFRPAHKITPDFRVKVYELDYRLQKNIKGEAEDEIRTGLISIPDRDQNSKEPMPLIVYSHGDDMGLSYEGLSVHLGALQESAIVIAPSFPGEPICSGDIGKRDNAGNRVLSCANPREMISPARGVSIPWKNDVDELLGMYDSFVKVAMNHFQGNKVLTDAKFKPYFIRQKDDAADRLKETLDRAGGMAYTRALPHSALFGVSRGGLVASLALAKAGAALFNIKLLHRTYLEEGIPLVHDIAKEIPKDLLAIFAKKHVFDPSYGYLPPATFHGIITLAAPSSITIGQYRIILEQIIKGYGKAVLDPKIPCLRQLLPVFDKYRLDTSDSKEVLMQTAYEIFSRDLSFLGALVMAPLKKWNTEYGDLPERGSYYLIHHKRDKIVPSEQSKIAYDVMSGFQKSEKVRENSTSPKGLNVQSILLKEESESNSCHLDWKFKRTQAEVDPIIREWYNNLF